MMHCEHCGRLAWKSNGGMGGGIAPDDEENCIRRGTIHCRVAHHGRDAGRREMLWLVAIGACWSCWLSVDGYHPDVIIALHDAGVAALQTLASTGDESAAALLQEDA